MDVFLCASARFFLGVNSGLILVSNTFGVPIILSNWFPFGTQTYGTGNICIPKLYFHKRKNRHLTLAEMLDESVAQVENSTALEKMDITLRSNTQEEIRDAVIGMLDSAEGISKPESGFRESLDRRIAAEGDFILNPVAESFIQKHLDVFLEDHRDRPSRGSEANADHAGRNLL